MVARPGKFSEEQLLDYVRGRASAELSAQIEAEVAKEPALRAEIALMRGLKPSLQDAVPLNPPGELGWRRLEADIRREGKLPAPANKSRRSSVWRVAAVVFGFAAIGQATYIGTVLNTPEEDIYRTASRATDAHVLGVGFASDATASDINALLRSVDARLIDGPSAISLYRVAFDTADALSAGRDLLDASPLIELVADE